MHQLTYRYFRILAFNIAALCFWTTAVADQPWRLVKSDQQPIAIAVHQSQVDRHLATRLRHANRNSGPLTSAETARIIRARNRIVAQTLRWAEQSYEREVVEMGFEKPRGIWHEIDGKSYLLLFLQDFGRSRSTTWGTVRRSDSRLSLNIAAFFEKAGPATRRNRPRIMQGTIAHELFHAIQNRYSVQFSRWAKESTAEWCVEQVFPEQNHFVNFQARFLRNPQHSLHRVQEVDTEHHANQASGHSHSGYAHSIGRPYGASAFWMFLEKHHTSGTPHWMAEVWRQAKTNDDAYAVLATVLGDGEKFGEKFRDYYTRFAVGSLLHDEAPEDCRWHDITSLTHTRNGREIKLRSPTTDLSDVWSRYLESGLRGPKSAALTVDWSDTPKPLTEQSGTRLQLNANLGSLAGTSYRIFRLPVAMMKRYQLPIRLEIPADENELEVRAVTQQHSAWQVIPATFSAPENGPGKHQVTIPALSQSAHGFVYFVVCRLGEDLQPKSYPLHLSMVQPPAVQLVRLTQGGATLFEAKWDTTAESETTQPSRELTQTALALPDSTNGQPVELLVELDQDCRRQTDPAGQLNGSDINLQPAESDRQWRCQLPAEALNRTKGAQSLELKMELNIGSSEVNIGLDENPVTFAMLDSASNRWEGYERDQGAFRVVMRPKRQYTASLEQNTMAEQRKTGPVWVSLKLNETLSAIVDQPYVVKVQWGPHVQYLYPTNVKNYPLGMHPLSKLNSFILSAGLESELPDQMTATFVTADGIRIEKTFDAELQWSKPVKTFGQPVNLEQERNEWRKRYQQVMSRDSDAEQKFSVSIREGSRLISYAKDFDEAWKIWQTTEGVYQQARAAEGADTDWLDRRFDYAELTAMGLAYRFQRIDELQQLLARRTARGQAIISDYLGVIDAVVRFRNDTATAHQLWRQMQELPDANRTKPKQRTMVENWSFRFDSLTDYEQELKLPRESITGF